MYKSACQTIKCLLTLCQFSKYNSTHYTTKLIWYACMHAHTFPHTYICNKQTNINIQITQLHMYSCSIRSYVISIFSIQDITQQLQQQHEFVTDTVVYIHKCIHVKLKVIIISYSGVPSLLQYIM